MPRDGLHHARPSTIMLDVLIIRFVLVFYLLMFVVCIDYVIDPAYAKFRLLCGLINFCSEPFEL